MQNILLINEQDGLARMMGNKGLFCKMLALFQTGAEYEEFKTVFESGDCAKAAQLAHTIKGVVGNLALTALYELMSEFNKSLSAGVMDRQMYEQYLLLLEDTRQAVAQYIADNAKK